MSKATGLIYRVIIALQKCGFFKYENGRNATQIDVFTAIGKALNDYFTGYSKNMTEGVHHNNDSEVPTAIFDELKDKFLEYEEKKVK